jgi:hypothetical protein
MGMLQIVLLVAAAILGALYFMRRKSRLNKEEE